ncbi:MlaC/ttg2D family ABC transporter substrate-binding protein [Marinobacterium arenosum]|uniref:MlaC/ttg2D family ABC transporter substrate-binding protein n=1 Tax=Marinobacterium arenosum TaxID=2862496 RepID=UPI001C9523D1|nr:ABC transporter substrate-binding protein [Marinobacterium arenosum]MBY4676771.1 ABC transporter substrate-binding protein [Marinobacterium arenosum]
MRNYQKAVQAVIGIWLLAMASLAQAGWDEAAAVVEKSTADILQLLNSEELQSEEAFGNLVGEVDRVLSPVVDFDYISKRVMGKYYRRASDAQRAQFSDIFKLTLLKTYAKALQGFQIKSYEMVPPVAPSPKPEQQAVSVQVTSANGTQFTLVYYMLHDDGRWKLVNASLDGINLRLTFKNQFAGLAQDVNGKVGKVIDLWQEKVSLEGGKSS